jgi:hypothetical protein
MFARAKGVLIVVCVLMFALTLMGQRAPVRPGQRPVVSTEPLAALVEAFIVEVDLPALARLGVSPIGEEPHAVTVPDILKCLGAGQARVVAGAKAAALQGNTEVRATKTTYVARETSIPIRSDTSTVVQKQKDYSPYESGRRFSVSTGAAPDNAPATAILVQFSLEESVFIEKKQDPDTPPDRAMWDWSGSALLQPGRPEIVAASQDAEKAVFLLLTAHPQGQ